MLASVSPISELRGVLSSLISIFIVSLGIDEGYCDGEDCHDDGDRKPGILGLYPRAECEHNDGKISWDGDEHCTDRLHFDFEFHSIMGVMPL